MPEPLTTTLASLHHSPDAAVFEKIISSIQMSDGRWFAWANANMTWDEWQAESMVSGISSGNDEVLRSFVPIPLFWSLESSSEVACESVLRAVVIHMAITYSNSL